MKKLKKEEEMVSALAEPLREKKNDYNKKRNDYTVSSFPLSSL